MATVRDLVHGYQREIQMSADLLPDRAALILTKLTALLGNINDEIRDADGEFAQILVATLKSEQKAHELAVRLFLSECDKEVAALAGAEVA